MADRVEILPAIPGLMEPEEAPAKNVFELPATISLGRDPWDPNAKVIREGIFPASSEMSAGEVARNLRTRCATCVHYRPDVWATTYQVWKEKKPNTLNAMVMQIARGALMRDPTPADLDACQAELSTWGVCAALTEHYNDVTVTNPEAGCPEDVDFYKDRDRAARKAASQAFDTIMRAAQGKR